MAKTQLVPRVQYDVDDSGKRWQTVRASQPLTTAKQSFSIWRRFKNVVRKLTCRSQSESPDLKVRFDQLNEMLVSLHNTQTKLNTIIRFAQQLVEALPKYISSRDAMWNEVRVAVEALEQAIEAAEETSDFEEAISVINHLSSDRQALKCYRHSWDKFQPQILRASTPSGQALNPKKRAEKMYMDHCAELVKISDSLLGDASLHNHPIFDEILQAISAVLVLLRAHVRAVHSEAGLDFYKQAWTTFSRWMTDA